MSVYDQIDLHDRATPDLDSLIEIHSEADAQAKHQRLIELMWGKSGLPGRMPNDHIADIAHHATLADNRFDHLANLRQIDRLVIRLPFGFHSNPYVFHPAQ